MILEPLALIGSKEQSWIYPRGSLDARFFARAGFLHPLHTGMLIAFINGRTAELLFYVSKDVGTEAAFVLFQFSKFRDHWWWWFKLLGGRQIARATTKEKARAS